MINIARPIDGISLNGNEWLLEENGETMKFQSKEEAIEFLKANGYEDFSDEELDDSFFFVETD